MPAILTATETAVLIGVSTDTIKRWSKAGSFVQPCPTVGGHWRFREEDVLSWIKLNHDVESIQNRVLDALEKIRHDETETAAARKWATTTLRLLNSGEITFADLIAANV